MDIQSNADGDANSSGCSTRFVGFLGGLQTIQPLIVQNNAAPDEN
jgi:hypothetical protein